MSVVSNGRSGKAGSCSSKGPKRERRGRKGWVCFRQKVQPHAANTREGAGEDILPGDVGNGSGLVLGVLKVGWWDVEMRGQGNGYGLTGVGRPRGQMGRWSWMW